MIHEIYPHRFDNHYVPEKKMGEKDIVFHFKDNTLLLKTDSEDPELPLKQHFSQLTDSSESIFLFTLDDTACFLVEGDLSVTESYLEYREISFFRTIRQKKTGWVALVAYHLWKWYTEHKYCGKCGTPTMHKEDERAIVCPVCGTLVFPKISPAIIVAIICNDKILLARNAAFVGGWYSLVAGYVDVGETLEETVKREVKEEVGLDVCNIRYYGSQPWALSGSMMIGFIAEADDRQPVKVDGYEITTAEWFTRGNLPAYPSNISIAGEIIEKFEQGKDL
jgi:NAD+ diphosphatase